MKKIILKFIGTGIGDKYQACVNIYDTYGNLILKKKTYNGILDINLKENIVYKLVATSCTDTIKTSFYVNKCSKEYIFIFSRSILSSGLRTITFLLEDANYNNLPIEKGEIILWQKL